MNVLLVVPALAPIYGGPSKSVIELACALGNQNIQVDVISTNANGKVRLDVPLQSWLKKDNYRIQYFSYNSYFGEYKFSIPLTEWLFQNVSAYDIVHTNSLFGYPLLAAYWACRMQEVPYLVTPRGMLETWALAYKYHKKHVYYKLFEAPALKRASAIHALTENEARSIKFLHLETPHVVIPNGIHRQNFDPLIAPDLFYEKFPFARNKRLLLFLGRIDPKKGLDLLATAFSKVHCQYPNVHLIVAGPDNIKFLSTVQRYFADAGCLEAVTFTGMLSGQLQYAALAAAEIYVAPSYSEGFSMSVLEGMASGLPCVITTGCNFPEIAEAKAGLVVNVNAAQIADAIIDCLKDPIAAKAMGGRARQFIFEQYSWDQIATKMIAVYEFIVQKSPILYST
jgi:glycosyltransferase involved in cell wall biosynthesis